MCMAAWLSHFNGIGITEGIVSSSNSLVSHTNSEQTFLMDLYSASAEERATVPASLTPRDW